ncbi:MAG: polysaccharide deacetylase family protein [Gemmatimonadota bacterium]
MIESLRLEATRLWQGTYPRFVCAREPGPPAGDYLPVFTFHTLEPGDFEDKLRYLRDNGYRTITLEQAVAHVRGDEPAAPRSVLLTIDDGRLSTWSVGRPLLRRFGMHAAAFVIAGFLEDGPPRPTLDDGDPTGGTGAALSEDRDRMTVLRWSEVEALHASDAVDVQSHTWMHKRVSVSRRLEGFVTPDDGRASYDVPCPARASSAAEARDPAWEPGAPIFEHAPILAVPTALEPPVSLLRACTDRARQEGGEAFFRRSGWRRELRRVVEACDDDFRRVDLEPHQRRELVASREALGRRLGGPGARHLCLPSGQASDRSVRLARESGYVSTLWGHLPAGRTNRPGADPHRIGRLKHDYVHRLPGSGRRGLLRVLAEKAGRRIRGDTGY